MGIGLAGWVVSSGEKGLDREWAKRAKDAKGAKGAKGRRPRNRSFWPAGTRHEGPVGDTLRTWPGRREGKIRFLDCRCAGPEGRLRAVALSIDGESATPIARAGSPDPAL